MTPAIKRKPGKGDNQSSKVVGIRLVHSAYEEACRRAKAKKFPSVGAYLRHVLQAFLDSDRIEK
jgi:hypothetical protein